MGVKYGAPIYLHIRNHCKQLLQAVIFNHTTHTHTCAQLASLIFIENQLALLLVNRPEHKLCKKIGYHWDLLLVGLLAGLNGLLGVPFMCAAAVRSVQHLQALSVYTSRNAPGEKPKLLRVHEQRVTNITVHILIRKPLLFVCIS